MSVLLFIWPLLRRSPRDSDFPSAWPADTIQTGYANHRTSSHPVTDASRMTAINPAAHQRRADRRGGGSARPRSSARRARRIADVIFGQETVVERALTTVLSGGHGLLVGVPGPRQDQARRHDGHGARAHRQPHPVHPRPDALRHPRLGDPRGERRPHAQLPLRARTGLRAAPDGRRDQPRQPAHAIGAAAGHAGAPRDHRRPAPRPAAAVPRARDAEPDRAGGHLSRFPRRSSTAS